MAVNIMVIKTRQINTTTMFGVEVGNSKNEQVYSYIGNARYILKFHEWYVKWFGEFNSIKVNQY